MYHSLLTRRYLLSKIMPLLAAAAVALCTAMVLVTWSVMGGFLVMLIGSGRTLTGDVVLGWPGTGFAHYEELCDRIEADPEVKAAAPMIETFGMLQVPGGKAQGVLIRGVDRRYADVSDYDAILWWRPLEKALRKDKARRDPRLSGSEMWPRLLENGRNLTRPNAKTGEIEPAVVPGIQVTGLTYREPEGYFIPDQVMSTTASGEREWTDVFLPRDGRVTLTVFPLDSQGRPYEPVSWQYPVANEFHSGLFDADERIVFANFEAVQKLLRMQAKAARPAPTQPTPGGESFATPTLEAKAEPARATHVVVRGKGNLDSAGATQLKLRIARIYDDFAKAHPGEVPNAMRIDLLTWEDLNRSFIDAVKNEISLLLFLFSLISLTAVVLVLAIFWSMVREKEQDIGVLRAIGASASGVAWLWVRYGLAIGLVGGLLGLGLSYALVNNINDIHDWLGRALGIVIWNPRTYYFSKIPDHVDPLHAAIVFTGGIVSCGVGALVPAVRAARMSPVKALRNE